MQSVYLFAKERKAVVIIVIHQPRPDIFGFIDRVLFLETQETLDGEKVGVVAWEGSTDNGRLTSARNFLFGVSPAVPIDLLSLGHLLCRKRSRVRRIKRTQN